MLTDIFEFWAQARLGDHIHPLDRAILARVKHGFDLRCIPASFAGPLRTAPLVLLFLSPGFSESDVEEAESKEGQQRYVERWHGNQALPGPSDPHSFWPWWSSRTKQFGYWGDLQNKIAILNIGAYHSKTFDDPQLLAALPSSRASLDWAQNILFPDAIEGKRVVVCMRAARFWGLDGAHKHGESLFVPGVTRGGFMLRSGEHDDRRDEVIVAAKKALSRMTVSY